MSITSKDIKLLWSRAAGRCSICRVILTYDSIHGNEVYPVGEQAHIVAESNNGPRGHSILSLEERNSYFNLILLCPSHHREIDINYADYPVEKLHIIKQAHEMWVLEALQNSHSDLNGSKPGLNSIADFVREWLDFEDFFLVFFIEVDTSIRDLEKKDWLSEERTSKVREWHRRRGVLRELLYLAGEDNLILQDVPDWQRLKRQEQYSEEGNYKTPFSFILDFVNPMAMINLHGNTVWAAWHISKEFIEVLSWQYPKIKEILTRARSA
jgi:hypothetical protein